MTIWDAALSPRQIYDIAATSYHVVSSIAIAGSTLHSSHGLSTPLTNSVRRSLASTRIDYAVYCYGPVSVCLSVCPWVTFRVVHLLLDFSMAISCRDRQTDSSCQYFSWYRAWRSFSATAELLTFAGLAPYNRITLTAISISRWTYKLKIISHKSFPFRLLFSQDCLRARRAVWKSFRCTRLARQQPVIGGRKLLQNMWPNQRHVYRHLRNSEFAEYWINDVK